MSSIPAVVAAFCTRNRPRELVRACASLAASVRQSGSVLDAILIVDGGALTGDQIAQVRAALAGSAKRIEHLDAAGAGSSLYRSRLVALERARSAGAGYVAFFDDDVELEADYILRLLNGLGARDWGALGGVDVLQQPPAALSRGWQRFIGSSSGKPGRTSRSGFVESQRLWSEHSETFESDYLSGCNMTVAVEALDHVPADAARHFVTYSLAEDLVLAAAARRVGPVGIDPLLRVRHHQSPAAREGRYEIGRQLVSNVRWLHARGIGGGDALSVGWTLGWMFARAIGGDVLARTPRGKALGMLAGLRSRR